MLLASRAIPVEVHGNGRFVIPSRDFMPAYLRTHQEGRLKEKADEALEALRSCTLCPRDCRVNRLENKFAVCKVGRYARVSSFFHHFGEEDVLRGWRGSGTIFFSWCNLRCVFCQNFETSQIGEGIEVTPHDLARMMLQLQDEGCHNINFVTPEHVVAQILEALPIAVEGGLRLPLVYNTSAYDSLHSIRLMDGVVDVYMPDFKLWDRERSRRYLLAPDYPDAAGEVIRAMHEQVGELKVNEDGLAVRGVLVRHLVMPGMLDDTREIMRYLAGLSRDTYVNVMDQYTPAWRARSEERFQDINRRVFRREMDEAYACAREAGLWRFDTRWRRVRLGAWAWV
ncbi:MAG: radical SAM protein [Armatimonadota bacterium]|nr:radical SAM protein [Armatimonadota bacterium]MDR7520069.1 radical SAM protein [Armatimonadota bacterium]MDR7550771.1 radical SAM protein [Armatimonadota bacterium]